KMLLPFIMASGFIQERTPLPFVIRNVVILVSAAFVHIGILVYITRMFVQNISRLGASMLVLYIVIRKDIIKKYDVNALKPEKEAIKDITLFRLSWIILTVLLVGYFVSGFIQIPISIIVGTVAVGFLIISRNSPAVKTKKVVKDAPWAIVFFSIGMYVVVYGLRNVGLTDILT